MERPDRIIADQYDSDSDNIDEFYRKHSMGDGDLKKQARRWFAFNASSYNNATEAAENCAHNFGHDKWLDDPDHWVWELAIAWVPGD